MKRKGTGMRRNTHGRGTSNGHAQKDFGRRTTGQNNWEVREQRKVRDSEIQKEKEVHGKKG